MTIIENVADSRESFYRMFAAFVVTIFVGSAPWLSSALVPDFSADFGVSRAEASYPYVLVMVGFFVATPIWSLVLARYGLKYILVFCGIIGAVSYSLAGLTDNFALVCLSFLGVGIASSVANAPIMSDLTFWFSRWRGFAVAAVTSGVYLSGLVWLYILELSRAHGDWRFLLFCLAAGMLALLALSYFFRARLPPEPVTTVDVQRAGTPEPDRVVIGILLVVSVICCFAMAMPQVHLVGLCMEIGLSQAQGTVLIGGMLVSSMLSRLVCAAIFDRVGAPAMLIGCSAIQASTLLFYSLSGTFMEVGTITLLFGVAQGGILPAYPLLIRLYVSPSLVNFGTAIVTVGTVLGMIIGGWAAGYFYESFGRYDVAMQIGFGANVLNILLFGGLVFWMRERRREGVAKVSAGRD